MELSKRRFLTHVTSAPLCSCACEPCACSPVCSPPPPGLSQPVLLILRNTAQAPIQEGDRVPVSCQAPGETGTFIFYFYDQGQEIHEEQTTSNQVEVELLFNKPGMRDMQCAYMVLMVPDAVKSNHSQAQYVRVRG